MNWDQLPVIVLEGSRRHWLSFALFLITLAVIVGSLLARYLLRRRWRALLDQDQAELEWEPAEGQGEHDQQALALIREARQAVWDLPETRLTLTSDFLVASTLDLVRRIAAVYHPHTDTPEFETSLAQSVVLAERVIIRLHRLTRFPPFRLLASRKLSEYQRFYRLVRQLNDNPLVQALKRHRRLYRIAGWLVSARHLANPFYWAGKDLTREGYFYLLRWFHATYLAQVGREAMRLYGGQACLSWEEEEAARAGRRLFQLCAEWGGPSAAEWALLVGLMAGMPHLDAQARLALLQQGAAGRHPGSTDPVSTMRSQRVKRWYRQALTRLEQVDSEPASEKKRCIERELRLMPR